MCGIVGLLDHDASLDDLRATIFQMNAVQHHRGPDSEGVTVSSHHRFSMGMKRLSIQDVQGGAQPMHSQCGRYCLVFNGEIMNAPSLRIDMKKDGCKFITSNSDTEVVLQLLASQGPAALKKLNGMFALAFLDKLSGNLIIARDLLGIKPLYFSSLNKKFAFSSEMKSLLQLNWVEKKINKQAVSDFFSLMYVTGTERIFQSIKQVEPGCLMQIDLTTGLATTQRWGKLNFEYLPGKSTDEWVVELRDEMSAAFNRWTLSDVPLAVSLSGGLDSSLIASIIKNSAPNVTAYSLGFTEKRDEDLSELEIARQHAQDLGLDFREIIMRPEDLISELAAMTWHLDEPYGGGLPSWLVYQDIGKEFKVALTGVGGDELFGNYGKWVPSERTSVLSVLNGKQWFRHSYEKKFHYWDSQSKCDLLTGAFANLQSTLDVTYARYQENRAHGLSHRSSIAKIDFDMQLPNEFLAMTDRFSMAHGVEARPPMLDQELVMKVLSMPTQLRTNRRELKGILKKIGGPHLSATLLQAPKRGFVLPMKRWLKEDLSNLVWRLLDERKLKEQGIFNPIYIRRLYNAFLNGKTVNVSRIWSVVMFQIWYANFIERDDVTKPLSTLDLMEG